MTHTTDTPQADPAACVAGADGLAQAVALQPAAMDAGKHSAPRLLRRIQRLRRLLTESRRALRQTRSELAGLRQTAACDELTGLPNRHGFAPPLQRELAAHAGGDFMLALLFVDLDGFKAINDRLGHAAGDEVLRIVGARLAAAVRRSDLVCRHGGDEFVCVLPQLRSPASASRLAAVLLRAIGQPCMLGGQEVRVRASVGVAIYPRDGDNLPALLHSADSAMYAAKSRRSGVAMARPGSLSS
jgi:diguanylate cyclase (GGDEF)-like protein